MENYNPPPLILAFDARGTVSQTINVPMEGTTKSLTIYSYRDTKVNGKVTDSDLIDFTTKITSGPNVSDTWIFTKKAVNDKLSYELELEISPNLGEARTGNITLTQASSGKTVTITISQAAGITVQEYVLTWALLGVILPPGGGSRTVEIESYVLYSDGSKQALTPDIISKPDWVTSVDIVSKDLISKFNVTISAPTNPNVARKGNITLKIPHNSVKGVELEIPVTQTAQITEQDITLTLKLPMENVTGTLFADGETPVNSSGVGGYFSFNSMFGQFSWTFKPSVGILVNLSSPGSTKYAKPGDRVKVYQNTSASSGGGTWSYIATFTMPSKDETIIL